MDSNTLAPAKGRSLRRAFGAYNNRVLEIPIVTGCVRRRRCITVPVAADQSDGAD